MAKTLTMPVNSNQKQDEKNTWIYNSGCAVCCGVDMASFFNKVNYSVADFILFPNKHLPICHAKWYN